MSSAASTELAQAPAPAFHAYLDFKAIQRDPASLVENCRRRGASADPERVAALYGQFLELQQAADRVRAERNQNSAQMKAKLGAEERAALVAAGRRLKGELEGLQGRLVSLEAALQVEGQRLPNATHPASPVGGEGAERLLRSVGTPPAFAFPPRDHVELAARLDLVDFAAGSTVAGPKFYYLKHEAALLEQALVAHALRALVAAGFVPHATPDLVREHVFERCGFQPRAANTQVYSVEGAGLCLAGTAEIPLAGLHMDAVLEEDQLPLRLAGVGHCFRTEAGAAGAAGRGLYRVHQFTKVEAFVLCTPEQSEALHEELLELEVGLFAGLGLHFKVLDMPSGDLGAPAYRKYDVEAWMPGLGRYGEISSASNCTDYQARRLNIRYRPRLEEVGDLGTRRAQGTRFVHTLNATGCAVPRMLVAILENFQQEDGSVVIPPALRPFMMGLEVIRPRKEALREAARAGGA